MQDTLPSIRNQNTQSSDVMNLERSLESTQLQDVANLEKSFNQEIGLNIATTTPQRQDLQLGATNLVDGLYNLQPEGHENKSGFFKNIGKAISSVGRNIKTSLTLGAKNKTFLEGFKALIPGQAESVSKHISLADVKQNNSKFIDDKVSAFKEEQAKLQSQGKQFVSQTQIDQYVVAEQAKLDQQYSNIARKVEQFQAMGLDPEKAISQVKSDYNGIQLRKANSFRNTLKGLTYGALGIAGVITFTGPAMLQVAKIFGNVGLTELNHRAKTHDKVSREVLEEAETELGSKVAVLLPKIEKGINQQSYDQIIGVIQDILAQDKLSLNLETILMDLVGALLAQKESHFVGYDSNNDISEEAGQMVTFLNTKLDLKSKKDEIKSKSSEINKQGFIDRIKESTVSNVLSSAGMVGFSWLTHQFNVGGNIIGTFNKFTAKNYVMPITSPDGQVLGSAVSSHSPDFEKFKTLYGEPKIHGDLAVFETNGHHISERDILSSIQHNSLNLDDFPQHNVTKLVDGKPIAIPGLSSIDGKEGFNGVTITDSHGDPHTFSPGNSGNPFNTQDQTVLGRIGNKLILADKNFDHSPQHLKYLKKELGLEPYSAQGGPTPIPTVQEASPIKGNFWGWNENGMGGRAGLENARLQLIEAGNPSPDGRAIIEQTFRIQGRDNLDAFKVDSTGFAENQTDAYFKGLKQIYGWDDKTIVEKTLSGQVPKSDKLAQMMSQEALKVNPNAPQFVGMRNELMAADPNSPVPGLTEPQPGVYKNPAYEASSKQGLVGDGAKPDSSALDKANAEIERLKSDAAKNGVVGDIGTGAKNFVDKTSPYFLPAVGTAAVFGGLGGGIKGNIGSEKEGWGKAGDTITGVIGGAGKGGLMGLAVAGGAGAAAVFGAVAPVAGVMAGAAGLEAVRRYGPNNKFWNGKETTYGGRAIGLKPTAATTTAGNTETTAQGLAGTNTPEGENERKNREFREQIAAYEEARAWIGRVWVPGSDSRTWPDEVTIRRWKNSINAVCATVSAAGFNSTGFTPANQAALRMLQIDLINDTEKPWDDGTVGMNTLEVLDYFNRERASHIGGVGGRDRPGDGNDGEDELGRRRQNRDRRPPRAERPLTHESLESLKNRFKRVVIEMRRAAGQGAVRANLPGSGFTVPQDFQAVAPNRDRWLSDLIGIRNTIEGYFDVNGNLIEDLVPRNNSARIGQYNMRDRLIETRNNLNQILHNNFGVEALGLGGGRDREDETDNHSNEFDRHRQETREFFEQLGNSIDRDGLDQILSDNIRTRQTINRLNTIRQTSLNLNANGNLNDQEVLANYEIARLAREYLTDIDYEPRLNRLTQEYDNALNTNRNLNNNEIQGYVRQFNEIMIEIENNGFDEVGSRNRPEFVQLYRNLFIQASSMLDRIDADYGIQNIPPDLVRKRQSYYNAHGRTLEAA
ncbi:MAG: hypothetical protein WCK98_04775 [bacterium]